MHQKIESCIPPIQTYKIVLELVEFDQTQYILKPFLCLNLKKKSVINEVELDFWAMQDK